MMKRLRLILIITALASEKLQRSLYDPNALEGCDAAHSTSENRFFIIGLSSRRLLHVVYAEREGNVIRIISARKAVKKEQEDYGQSTS
jgi:uncharacterized DUF497 family protein